MPYRAPWIAFFTLLTLCGAHTAAAADGGFFSRLFDGASSESSGKLVKQPRQLPPFHAVSSRGSADLDIRIGASQSVVVEADRAILDHIRTRVEHGNLIVDAQGSWHTTRATVVHITVPSLEAAALLGSGDAKIAGLHGSAFSLRIAGSGDADCSGTVTALNVSIQGSGDAGLLDLKASDVNVAVDGSGDVHVTAERSLNATVNGSGDVIYAGHAQQVNAVTNGSGDIVRR